ncbi:MAG: class I SAM-dependent methyltransferase [Coleofasciculaceae cyanobacterium]
MQDLEQQKSWYSAVADAYNRVRPRYPKELIGRVVELAQLQNDAIILEVGCGPGTATAAFAQLGFSMVCLEPSQESCQLARQNCAQYPNVEILNITFEEWELELERFNAVLAATSFHWVSPEVRYAKAAAALQNNGSLMLLWNTPPQPGYEIYQVLDEVYQSLAPSVVGYETIETHQENLRRQGQAVIDSGCFKELVSEQMMCEVTYSIDDYLALLSTLSPYIRLDSQQRDSLFAGLRERLKRHCPENLQLSYLSVFQMASKIISDVVVTPT